MIHTLADVKTKKIGKNTTIWQYVVILDGAQIGENCNINCHTFIENDVVIGNNVTVKSGVYLWNGIKIEDNVFIGPNVTFTNDSKPRSKEYPLQFQGIKIKKNASIGAGSIILGGVELGEYSLIGAGALVTKSVPDYALMIGAPAKIVGWVNKDGSKMKYDNGFYIDDQNKRWVYDDNELKPAP